MTTERTRLFLSFFFENEHDLKNYIQMLVRDWNITEEIVQETVVVLWEKYADVSEGDYFRKILFIVAKNKVLSYRRRMAQNRLFFDEEAISLLTDASIERKSESKRQKEILDEALATLSLDDRRLLLDSYCSEHRIKELAQEQGKTPNSLYKRLQKIRNNIFKTVQKNLEGE